MGHTAPGDRRPGAVCLHDNSVDQSGSLRGSLGILREYGVRLGIPTRRELICKWEGAVVTHTKLTYGTHTHTHRSNEINKELRESQEPKGTRTSFDFGLIYG